VWEERYPQEPFNLPPDPTEQEQPFFIKKTENNFIPSHNLFTKKQLLKTYAFYEIHHLHFSRFYNIYNIVPSQFTSKLSRNFS
jgi:hypothetical protein